MFRRLASSASRFAVLAIGGAGGAQLASAVVTTSPQQMSKAKTPLTDAQLNKKPYWYKETVIELEDVLKKLSQYSPIESRDVLEKAYDTLIRVQDQNHVEVYWRIARVLVEKAELSSGHDQEHLLHEAVDYAKKAMAVAPAGGSAGAHKWYALALGKLVQVDHKLAKTVKADEEMTHHFERAVKLDPKDAYAWFFLGRQHYHRKDYREALKCFQKGEEVKPGFSAANLYHLGDTLVREGKKEEGVEALKRAANFHNQCMLDNKGKNLARGKLTQSFKLNPEDISQTF